MKLYQVAAVLLVSAVALILAAGTLSYYESLVHGACSRFVYDDDSIVFVYLESRGAVGLFYVKVVPDDTEYVLLTDLNVTYNLTEASGLLQAPTNTTVHNWREQMTHFYTSTHLFIVKVVGPHGNLSLPVARPCIKPAGL